MLTHIKTPKVLIPNVRTAESFEYDHGRGDKGTSRQFSASIQITPEMEADLPAYIRERVKDANWYGMAPGTRFIRLSCSVRPVVFGVSAADVANAAALNIDLDQIIRGRPAVVCVSMGRSRSARSNDTFPILRALLVDRPVLPESYEAYTNQMESYWEFPE